MAKVNAVGVGASRSGMSDYLAPVPAAELTMTVMSGVVPTEVIRSEELSRCAGLKDAFSWSTDVHSHGFSRQRHEKQFFPIAAPAAERHLQLRHPEPGSRFFRLGRRPSSARPCS